MNFTELRRAIHEIRQFQKLIQAAQRGDLQCVQQLIAQGCDLNATDKQGNSALNVCTRAQAREGLIDCVRVLVDAGCDINHKGLEDINHYFLFESVADRIKPVAREKFLSPPSSKYKNGHNFGKEG